MKNKELIGYIGIDSGQVLIVDPCYLSNWKDDEYDDTRGIRKGNKTYLYGKDFETYEEPLKKENNKTPNELVKEGWEIYQINEAKHGGKRGGEAYTKVYFRK